MTAEDINIGIGALLETFEMMHVFPIFSTKNCLLIPYQVIRVSAYMGLHVSALPTRSNQGRKRTTSSPHPAMAVSRPCNGFPRNLSGDLDRLRLPV